MQERIDRVLHAFGKAKDIFAYAGSAPGKRLRPLLVLLTFDLCEGHDFEEALNCATGVELVHMASLIHDDVIDNGELRRGQMTLHRRFGTEAAVLAGDHFFAAAFHLFALCTSSQVSQLMTAVIQEMCVGEINQLFHPVTEELDYFEYIRKKTARLIGGCCRLGAILADRNEFEGAILQEFGDSIGLAFQLTDDVLDYKGVNAQLGKKVGRDFAERIWTLPTIRAYERGLLPFNWFTLDFDHVRSILQTEGILDEVWQVASDHVHKAMEKLEIFPDSHTKGELKALSARLLERNS